MLKRSQDAQEDLTAEHELLRRLAGPGLPTPLESFHDEACTYLLREYVAGEPLLDYAQKRGLLPAREVRNIGLSLCCPLKRLHSQHPPVIHRDIKLDNIIRTPSGECVLIDLGIALHELATGEPSPDRGKLDPPLQDVVERCIPL